LNAERSYGAAPNVITLAVTQQQLQRHRGSCTTFPPNADLFVLVHVDQEELCRDPGVVGAATFGGGVGWSTWTSEGVAAAEGRSDTRLASVGAKA
jgi:hypothetical protein